MPEDGPKKRNIAFERLISGISKDDVRIAVIGTVVSVDNDSLIFTIDDNTGSLTILAPNNDFFSKVKEGSMVRVIGLVLPHDNGFELRGELIQDFSDLDKGLLPIIQEIIRK